MVTDGSEKSLEEVRDGLGGSRREVGDGKGEEAGGKGVDVPVIGLHQASMLREGWVSRTRPELRSSPWSCSSRERPEV